MAGTVVKIRTADGMMDCYLAGPKLSDACASIVLFMDGIGYRKTLTDMADRLATRGLRLVLPNLYYRHGSVAPLDVTTVFAPGAEQERMMSYYQSLSTAMVMRDLTAILGAPECGMTGSPALGCVGYCMGGAFALAAAGRFPDRIAAAASIHGGGLVTPSPDSPDRSLANAKGRLYLGFAGLDPYFHAEQAGSLAANAYAAGIDLVTETYAGVYHGFAVADTPAFNAAAAARHWRRLETFFGEALATQ
jgi:carboxymethylenebutenolidase